MAPSPHLTVRVDRELQELLRASARRLGYPTFTAAVTQALCDQLLGEMRPYDARRAARMRGWTRAAA
jgi:hypothetical protein